MKKTRRVAVAELKAQLSEYLRLVKGGRELIVTERGRPIATIAPVNSELAGAGRVEELVASGLARAPLRRIDRDQLRRQRPHDPGGRSLQILLDERADGR